MVPVILLVTSEPAPPAAPLLMETAPAETTTLSVLPAITATLLFALTSDPLVVPALEAVLSVMLEVTFVPSRLVATEPAKPICEDIAIPTATVEMLAFEFALTATLPEALSFEPVTPALTLLAMLL